MWLQYPNTFWGHCICLLNEEERVSLCSSAWSSNTHSNASLHTEFPVTGQRGTHSVRRSVTEGRNTNNTGINEVCVIYF